MRFLSSFNNLFFATSCKVCLKPISQKSTSKALCSKCTPQNITHKGKVEDRCNRCFKLGNQDFCDLCIKIPSYINSLRFLWDYDQNARDVIHVIKFEKNMVLCKEVGSLLAKNIYNLYKDTRPTWDFIISIPSRDRTYRERGFNQSQILAESISKELSIPFYKDLIKFIKTSKTDQLKRQAELPLEKRIRKLDFLINIDSKKLSNSRILIIDDVMTTGSTIFSAAHALAEAVLSEPRIKSLDVISLARAYSFINN